MAKKINGVSRPVVFDKNYIMNVVKVFERIYDTNLNDGCPFKFSELLFVDRYSEYNKGDVGVYNQRHLYDILVNTKNKFGYSNIEVPEIYFRKGGSYVSNPSEQEYIFSDTLYQTPLLSAEPSDKYEFLLNISADKFANIAIYILAAFFAKRIPFEMAIPDRKFQSQGFKYPIKIWAFEKDLEYVTSVFDKISEQYHPSMVEDDLGFAKYNNFIYYDCIDKKSKDDLTEGINRTEFILDTIRMSIIEVIKTYNLVDEKFVKICSSLSDQTDRALFIHWIHQCEEKDSAFWDHVYEKAIDKLQSIGLDINDLFGEKSANVAYWQAITTLDHDANYLEEDEKEQIIESYHIEYNNLIKAQNEANSTQPESVEQEAQTSPRPRIETEYFDINRVPEENSQVVQTSTQPTIETEYFTIPSNTPSDDPQANDKPEEKIETGDFVKYAWITEDPNFFNRTIEVKDYGQMTVYAFLDLINADDLLRRALGKDYQDFMTNPNVNLSGVVLADAKITTTSVVDFFEYVISLAPTGDYEELLITKAPQFLLHREDALVGQNQLAMACNSFSALSANPDYYNRRIPYADTDETVGDYLLKGDLLKLVRLDDIVETGGETLTGAAFWNYALTLVGRFSLDKIKEDFILDIKSSKNMEPAEAPRKLSLKERLFGRSRK